MSAAVLVNEKRYGELLAGALPRVIETEEESERLTVLVERLLAKGKKRSPEESELMKLVVKLIEDFEQRNYQLNRATPREALQELMEARGLRQSDLVPLFGSKGLVSEVINGKREISKTQIKALSDFFHVSTELFI